MSKKIYLPTVMALFLCVSTLGFAGESDWMDENKDVIGDIPMTELAIPGSHDSATSDLDKHSDYASDHNIPDWFQKVAEKFPFLPMNKVVAGWSQAQKNDIKTQLKEGIRYLDLRVCYEKDKKELYTCHAMISTKVSKVIDEIHDFSKKHPNEIIILHFQHLYGMDDTSRAMMEAMINDKLSEKLVPNAYKPTVTPNELWQTPYRFITIYNDPNVQENSSDLWKDKLVDNPWANTPSMSDLKDDLESYIDNRDMDKFFVLQSIRTPNEKTVIQALDPLRGNTVPHSLKEMAQKTNPEIINKITKEWYKKPQNIIMMDWVDNHELTDLAVAYNKYYVKHKLNK